MVAVVNGVHHCANVVLDVSCSIAGIDLVTPVNSICEAIIIYHMVAYKYRGIYCQFTHEF